MSTRCDRVTRHLPGLATGDLSRLRQRLVRRHVARCDTCAAALAAQERVTEELAAVAATAEAAVPAPPDDLLARLLAQAEDPGLRARVAVPARGAVSGARPGLSLALGIAVVALAVTAGWAGWHLGRRWRGGRTGTRE